MKSKIKKYIINWKYRGYKEDIPDEIPIRLHQLKKAPSYKSIALAILNNDYALKSLGYDVKKSKVYDAIKKEELSAKGKINKQLKLNLR